MNQRIPGLEYGGPFVSLEADQHGQGNVCREQVCGFGCHVLGLGEVRLTNGVVSLQKCQPSEHQGHHKGDGHPTEQVSLATSGPQAARQNIRLLEFCRLRTPLRSADKPLLSRLEFASREQEAGVQRVLVPLEGLLAPFGVLTICVEVGVDRGDEQLK